MKSKLNLMRLACVLAAVIGLSMEQASAQSATLTYTQTFGPGQGPTSSGIPFSFPAFDPSGSGGALISVTIELSNISTTGTATVYNLSNIFAPPGYNEDLTGGFTNKYVVTDSASDAVTVNVISGTQSQTAVPAGSNFTTGTLTGTQSPPKSDVVVTDPGDYDTSMGSHPTTVTVYLTANTTVNASATAGTNTAYVGGSASATGQGSISVIYTYVPEPSEEASWFIGFALLVMVGRKYLRRPSAQEPPSGPLLLMA